MKTVFIAGITGQDGASLAERLLGKGWYWVAGGFRRLGTSNFRRLDELGIPNKVELYEVDLLDARNLPRVIEFIRPDGVFNLVLQSFVAHSFCEPILAAKVIGLGVSNLIKAIRIINPAIKFCQELTSEFFGLVHEILRRETPPFYPRSPDGVAKICDPKMIINYRESYNIFAFAGFLFNP